ncbi:type II toxin-antitoxin system RelE/ParE family toxin [Candidatus Pacearchaeota archaeon]|nr:type II toxin-antitoxin system RelE/ParE family toxin [Candidatus Pacearchaeota archaeon]
MVRDIVRTETFIRQLSKLGKFYIDRIEKLVIRIIQNPEVGKPMRFDRKGTRELYLKPFRLSYAYDKEKDTLYFLAIYHKDEQ